MVDSSVCMNEAKLWHIDAAIVLCCTVFAWQVLFPVVDSSVCMNEAKLRRVDAAIAADFKGCCNDSALVCSLQHVSLLGLYRIFDSNLNRTE